MGGSLCWIWGEPMSAPGYSPAEDASDVARVGLPVNLDAERFLLAAGMRNADDLDRIIGATQAEDFSNEPFRKISRTQRELHDRGDAVDMLTVASHLRDAGQLESVGGMTAIISLDDGLGSVLDLEPHIRAVKDKSILRRAIFAAEKLKADCLSSGDSAAVLESAQRIITDLSAEREDRIRPRTVKKIVIDSGGPNRFWTPEKSNAIATPWPRLNAILGGGVRPQQMVVIAARPGVGKSAMAGQIAEHVAARGTGVALYSLEMSASEILKRMACSSKNLDSSKIRRQIFSESDRVVLAEAMAHLGNLPLWIDDATACTPAALSASLRRLRANHSVGLVVIDYLQLMDSTGRHSNRTEAVSAISRAMKRMARELDVAVIALSQLNRGSENEKRRPVLSDLRESGAIEQDADVVGLIHREQSEPNEANLERTACELAIAKQRSGPTGTIRLSFSKQYTRFDEAVG